MGPVFAGLATLLVGLPSDGRIGVVLLVALTFGSCQLLADRHAANAAFLPLVRAAYPLAGPLMGAGLLCLVKATAVVPALEPRDIAVLSGVALAGVALSRIRLPLWARDGSRVRIGIVGSGRTASDLAAELERSGRQEFTVVGYVPPEPDETVAHDMRPIGALGNIAQATAAHEVDLLLLSSEVPRVEVFDELAHHPLDSTVRVIDLSAFYEEVFGHVALSAINASWFQWVLHPRYSPRISPAKRALDLIIAMLVLVASTPVMAVLVLLVRMDGGPAFYRQVRIGEGGREFEILKLRSMTHAWEDASAQWSSSGDHRVTRVGSMLRRTHLDELPQVLNVLRGEMSIVGPRPEQPWFVERLELVIPFYSRRHLVRPGITGWAQVHCGYANSDVGSAMKVCHDLYYLKHRSIAFDLLIVCETLRTPFAPRQWDVDPREQRFVLPLVEPAHEECVRTPRLETA